ncbi:MAG: hypothetical protein JWQ09_3329 [Segetibacter sp.]|nr:hypothetical protein [Segetibacter sp.]
MKIGYYAFCCLKMYNAIFLGPGFIATIGHPYVSTLVLLFQYAAKHNGRGNYSSRLSPYLNPLL